MKPKAKELKQILNMFHTLLCTSEWYIVFTAQTAQVMKLAKNYK